MGTVSRLLRTLAGVELWHVETKGGEKHPIISYVVKSTTARKAFEKPHQAWQYFQHLTNAPDRDTRPEPPPIGATHTGSVPPVKRRPRTPPDI
jgi:hypothetical protein